VTRKLLTTLTLLSGPVLLALWPSSAAARDIALVTQPVTVGGYTMRIVAEKGNDVSVTLFRRVGGSIQEHEWWANRRFRLHASQSLRSGSLSARFGTRGRVRLRFRARGRASRGMVPWCDHRRQRVAGTLTRRFELRTGPGRFGKIVERGLHAWLSRGPKYGTLYCTPPDLGGDLVSSEKFPQGSDPALGATVPHGLVSIWNTTAGGTVEAVVWSSGGGYHRVVAHSRKVVFSVSSDLTSASATGIGPFLSGRLSFTGPAPPDASGGSIAGHLRIGFVTPGRITITRGPATLDQGGA
jgi:hypothetical protein